jgi:hypothetical protein
MDFDGTKEEFLVYLDGAEQSVLSFCRLATKHDDMCLAAKMVLILEIQDTLAALSATRIEVEEWYDTYMRRGRTPRNLLISQEKERIDKIMLQYGITLHMDARS